ncbi:MAG: LPD38 domain-containing protein, partial [Flavobacterium sp.]
FNQGGTVTKDLDAFIPYLNAAGQGTRVMFDNFRDRPIETTLRVTQAVAFVAPIPIGLSLMFLGSSERGEDEKELSSTELYNKALKGVSKYDRSNYFIIFTGNRNANGEFEYYRIAKAQQLTPFFTLVEGTLQKVMRESVGDKESGTMIEDLNWILQNNISPVEFAVTDNLARNPLLKAALSMSTGYDFFREQDISPDRGKVPVAVEGFGSKSVEDFYKKIGETSGWSPARMKAAVESIITTPSTSPYVGMIYGGMDAMFSDKDTDVIMQKFAKDMAKSSVNRVVKETSEYNRRIGNKEKIKDAVEKIETDRLKLKLNFNTLVSDLKEGKITEKQLTDEINTLSKTEPFEAKRIANRVKDQLRNKNTPAFVFEVKYANTAKERAVLLADKFGDALLNPTKMDEKERLIIALLKKNSAINKETLMEYENLVK